MKTAVYSPYLDTNGGGERYILTIAQVLSEISEVDLLLDDHLIEIGGEELVKKVAQKLNINLSKIRIVKAPLGKSAGALARYKFFKKYDCLFFLTDGSFFYSSSKKSYIHIQTPLTLPVNLSLKNRFKLSSWTGVIYNSEFTKEHSKKYWPIKSWVVYPPVDTNLFKPLAKKKIILSVGRFFGFLREKKHALMIEAFKKLVAIKKVSDWSLALAGSASEGDTPYLEELKKLAKDYPINFYPNIDFKELVKLYGEASIYWHASGFGETDPTKMEHFGISTVEAMSAGVIPVVINKGGQKEIVEDGKSGFLWNASDELIKKTLELIAKPELINELSKEAIERSKNFSLEKFEQIIKELVSG